MRQYRTLFGTLALLGCAGCTTPQLLDAGVSDAPPALDAPAADEDAPATADATDATEATDASGVDAPSGFSACPPGTITVRHADGPWGREVRSSDFGRFGEGVILSFEVIPDRSTSVQSSTWAWYTGGAPARDWSVTTTACDFSGATTLPGAYGGRDEGRSATPTFYWQAGTSLGGTTTMLVGSTYYINFRNEPGACTSGDCVLLGQMTY